MKGAAGASKRTLTALMIPRSLGLGSKVVHRAEEQQRIDIGQGAFDVVFQDGGVLRLKIADR
jgi:hypothetical protein